MESWKSRFKAIRPIGHLMVACFLFFAGSLLIFPFLADILLGSLCPGELQCSQVILLMGGLQLSVGIGTVVLAPILGCISDDYGRKPVFKLIFFIGAVPSVLLAYSRAPAMIYVWFAALGMSAILREGGLVPAILSYVADLVNENQRPSAVGLTMSSLAFGLLVGTAAALILPSLDQATLAAVVLVVCSTVYLAIFVKESNPRVLPLPGDLSQSDSKAALLPKPVLKRQNTKLRETAWTVWSSVQLRTIAMVDFMNSFAMGGLQTFAMYFLKAVLDFGKNEFAILVLVAAVGTAFGQMILYPALSHLLGERGVLWTGLIFTAIHYFVYALSFQPWVPYVAAGLALLYGFIAPALGTMVSRGVDQDQQGRVQGFMGGVRSTAGILSPLVMTPLTAIALGENPYIPRSLPFVICGAAMVVALLISLRLAPAPPREHSGKPADYIEAPLPPEACVHVPVPTADLLHVPIHEAVPTNSEEEDKNTLPS